MEKPALKVFFSEKTIGSNIIWVIMYIYQVPHETAKIRLNINYIYIYLLAHIQTTKNKCVASVTFLAQAFCRTFVYTVYVSMKFGELVFNLAILAFATTTELNTSLACTHAPSCLQMDIGMPYSITAQIMLALALYAATFWINHNLFHFHCGVTRCRIFTGAVLVLLTCAVCMHWTWAMLSLCMPSTGLIFAPQAKPGTRNDLAPLWADRKAAVKLVIETCFDSMQAAVEKYRGGVLTPSWLLAQVKEHELSKCYLAGANDNCMKRLWSPSEPAAFSGANGRKNLLDAVLQSVRDAASTGAPSGTSREKSHSLT